MQTILDLGNINIILLIINFILIIGLIINFIHIYILNKKYNDFLFKVGDGQNFQKNLNNYEYELNNVIKEVKNLEKYCEKIEDGMSECIQKVGVIRYNNSKENINDLSFAVALLDINNTGVVFNGIYSKDMNNIYAKPIIKGTSRYKLSKEEKEAIKKAIYNNDIDKMN